MSLMTALEGPELHCLSSLVLLQICWMDVQLMQMYYESCKCNLPDAFSKC